MREASVCVWATTSSLVAWPGATALDTYFIGQVVGGFTELRPAGEITREMVEDCTRRLRELGELAGS